MGICFSSRHIICGYIDSDDNICHNHANPCDLHKCKEKYCSKYYVDGYEYCYYHNNRANRIAIAAKFPNVENECYLCWNKIQRIDRERGGKYCADHACHTRGCTKKTSFMANYCKLHVCPMKFCTLQIHITPCGKMLNYCAMHKNNEGVKVITAQ